MSLTDRIKSLFGGGAGDGHDHHDHAHDDHVGHSHDEPIPAESDPSASLGTPGPAPVDPLGTTTPAVAPETRAEREPRPPAHERDDAV